MSVLNSNFDSLKKYDDEPLYKVTIQSGYSYKVYVNDILIYSRFSHLHYATLSFFINSALFVSGKQDIKVKLYPSFTDATTQEEILNNTSKLSFELFKTAWRNGVLIQPQNILTYTIPNPEKEEGRTDFKDLKEYVLNISFDAKLPFELNPLENSKNLKDENIENLTKEVLEFYNGLKNNFKNKQGEIFMQKISKAEYLVYQCNYLTKEEAIAKNKNWLEYINEGGI
jgi:hypothetical protein